MQAQETNYYDQKPKILLKQSKERITTIGDINLINTTNTKIVEFVSHVAINSTKKQTKSINCVTPKKQITTVNNQNKTASFLSDSILISGKETTLQKVSVRVTNTVQQFGTFSIRCIAFSYCYFYCCFYFYYCFCYCYFYYYCYHYYYYYHYLD